MNKKSKKSFESTLRLTNIALLISGIRIYEQEYSALWTKLIYYVFYLNVSFVYFDVIGELWWLIDGIAAGKSILELSLIAPCFTVSLLGTAKALFLFKNQYVVLRLIKILRNMHPKDTTDEKGVNEVEEKIFDESEKILNFVIWLLYYISALVTVAFTLLPAVIMLYDYFTTGETEYKYPYLVKYFFDPYTKEFWPFLYLHQVWSTVIVAANVFGADTLFYALCVYIQMHFRILCHRLENMTRTSLKHSKLNFKICIENHQELIRLVAQMDVLYSKSTLFNILTSSVLICLSGFNMTVLDDITLIATFGSFLLMSLSQIFLLCFFGDMLMTSPILEIKDLTVNHSKTTILCIVVLLCINNYGGCLSASLSSAVYNSQWYNTDGSTKRSVLLVLIRAQKPCKLTAAKFADLNLRAFTTILSRSWSYFALLRTMYD